MKHHDFIACSQDEFPSAGSPRQTNYPVNLSMCSYVAKNIDKNSSFNNICFGEGIPSWGYDNPELRDTDYERIMERIGCGDDKVIFEAGRVLYCPECGDAFSFSFPSTATEYVCMCGWKGVADDLVPKAGDNGP